MIFFILLCFNLGSLIMAACSDSEFIGCVIRLKSQGAPFGRNMMKVVFDVETEAKLLHTCKVYGNVLPCFSQKIEVCGDAKQKRLMKEVDSIFMFLCSPFSLQRQSLFLKHRECISGTMNKARKSTKCNLTEVTNGEDVLKCKDNCMVSGQADIVCMVNSWVSEQNVCTLNEIQVSCGQDAADFYKSIQQYVFDPKFPIVCEESIYSGSNKNSTKKETLKKNEKKIRKKNKIYKKVTENVTRATENVTTTTEIVTTTTELSPNDSLSQVYLMPMKKESQNLNEIFDVSKYSAKPVEATYKIYNSLRAVLQANMSPQIVDMFKKTSDSLNIQNKNIEYITPKAIITSTIAPMMTQSVNKLDKLITSTTISYNLGNNMISSGDGFNQNNMTTTTKKKLITYVTPRLNMSKWRPWYLDGN